MNIEEFMSQFVDQPKPKKIHISEPDYLYHCKRAKLYFSLKERCSTDPNVQNRDGYRYKMFCIKKDFEALAIKCHLYVEDVE